MYRSVPLRPRVLRSWRSSSVEEKGRKRRASLHQATLVPARPVRCKMKNMSPSEWNVWPVRRICKMNRLGPWLALGIALAALACRSSSNAPPRSAAALPQAAASPGMTAADVDRALASEWQKRGVVASDVVDDE